MLIDWFFIYSVWYHFNTVIRMTQQKINNVIYSLIPPIIIFKYNFIKV